MESRIVRWLKISRKYAKFCQSFRNEHRIKLPYYMNINNIIVHEPPDHYSFLFSMINGWKPIENLILLYIAVFLKESQTSQFSFITIISMIVFGLKYGVSTLAYHYVSDARKYCSYKSSLSYLEIMQKNRWYQQIGFINMICDFWKLLSRMCWFNFSSSVFYNETKAQV